MESNLSLINTIHFETRGGFWFEREENETKHKILKLVVNYLILLGAFGSWLMNTINGNWNLYHMC